MGRLLALLVVTLVACSPSPDESDEVATITCNIIGESKTADGAMRIKEVNAAREKIGAQPYLGTDRGIVESLEWGLCKEFVKDDPTYLASLDKLKSEAARAEIEERQIAAEEKRKKEEERRKKEKEAADTQLRLAELQPGFFVNNAERAEITETSTGLQYEVLRKGRGKTPSINDEVEVHYRGELLDGTVFDSSYERGKSITLGVSQVILGWTEALQLMSEGAKYKLYIPSELAYGEQGAGQIIPPNAILIFELELIKVISS